MTFINKQTYKCESIKRDSPNRTSIFFFKQAPENTQTSLHKLKSCANFD